MVDMLTYHLQLKLKNKIERPFLIYKAFMKISYSPPLSVPTVNLSVVEFIHILTAFYHLLISLETHIDASKYAQVGLNYALNQFV